MADSYITDPDLLKQLDTPEDAYVSDPELLKQLNGGDDLAVTEGTRRSYANELAQSLQKSNLFTSATSAAEGAWDKDIRRTESGEWDLPLMAPIKPAEGILGSVVSTIGGATTALGQKLGARMDLAGPGVDKQAVQSAFNEFQKANNLSDEEVQTAWKDFGNINRTWQDDEKFRVLSNGTIFPNQSASEWLDPEKAEAIISKAPTSDEAKQAMRDKLPDIRNAIAANKLEAYEAASDTVNKATAAQSLGTLGLSRAVAGKFTPPSEWAKQQNRTDTGTPEFVRDYENAVVNDAPWIRQKLWGLAGKAVTGWGQVANTVLGLGGMAGSETAAKLAGEGAEAQQTISQGLPDTGIVGAAVEQVPSLLTQMGPARLLGLLGSKTITALGTFGMAGAQSAGMTYADLISQGVDPQTARDKAVKTGVSTAVITSLFGTGGAGGVESAIAGKEIGEVTMKELVDIAREQGVKDFATSPQFRSFVGTVLKEAGGEAAEEGIDQFAQAFLTADPDTSVADAWSQAKDAAMVGGALGGGVQLAMKAMPNAPEAARAAMQPVSEVPVTQAETRREGETEPATAPSATQPTPQTNENPQLEMPVPAVQAAEQGATGESAAPVPEAGLSPMEGSAGLAPAVEEGVVKSIGPRKPGSLVPQFETPEGATVEVLEDGKVSVIVPPEARGQGVGNAAVERVKNYADATGTTITLDIEPLGNEPSMTRDQLADWYERQGFTVSEDRKSATYQPTQSPNEQNPQGQPGQETTPQTPQTQAPVQGGAQGVETGGEGAVVRDATKPEQMTPDEATERVWPPGKNIPRPSNGATANLNGQPAIFNGGWTFVNEALGRIFVTDGRTTARLDHQASVIAATQEHNPVSAETVDTYGIQLPEGYVRQGELYIYQPTQQTNAPIQRNQQQGDLGERPQIDEGGTPEGASGGNRAVEGGEEAAYSVQALADAFNLTDEQAVVADSIAKALGARIDLVAKGGVPGGGALSQASDADTARFTELTATIPANPTQVDLDAWKAANPEAYAELKAMRERVLREAGYDQKGFHRTKTNFTEFIPGGLNAEINTWFTKDGQKRTLTGPSGKAVWFGPSPDNLPAYHNDPSGKGPVISVLLKNKLPLQVDDDTREWAREVYADGSREFPLLLSDEHIADIRKDGYTGIQYWEKGKTSEQGDPPETIVFDPTQIKSTEPLNLDESGKLIPPSQWGDTGSPSILYQSGPVAPAFYSTLSRVIEQKMPKSATPAQVMQIAASGAKAEEVKWSGLEQALDRLAVDGKVPKQALTDYLRDEGRVRFEEVVASDNLPEGFPEGWSFRLDPNSAYGVGDVIDPQGRAVIDAGTEDAARREAWNRASTFKPKFSQYTLPGGENYREVVLAMPERDRLGPLRPSQYSTNVKITFPDGRSVTNLVSMSPSEADQAMQVVRDAGNTVEITPVMTAETIPAENKYTSSHFPDVPNYVAHMRTNERTDADGKPGLFVEEFQSDRHQAGRKQGYREDRDPKAIEEARKNLDDLQGQLQLRAQELRSENGFPTELRAVLAMGQEAKTRHDAIRDADTRYTTLRDQVAAARQRLAMLETDGDIPDAPFRTTWPLALFKRALRDAVASGKEWIGWTVGETQNDRFDLSKQVDKIDYSKARPGKHLIIATKDGSEVTRQEVNTEDLPGLVGKDVAQRIVDGGDSGTLSGEGLQVGGSGMKGFYDNILPKEIGKYVKQWGAKVEQSNLKKGKISTATRNEDGTLKVTFTGGQVMDFPNLEAAKEYAGNTPIWRIDITPEMRKSILESGQPLFQDAKASFEITESGKILLRGLQNPDFSSAVHEIAHAARRSMDQVLDEKEVRIVEQWAGVKQGKWGRYNEEKWARAWERYFREGKAPLARLQGIFDKIAGWMTEVYRNIVGSEIDVEITPEVRAIFDKLAGRMEVPDKESATISPEDKAFANSMATKYGTPAKPVSPAQRDAEKVARFMDMVERAADRSKDDTELSEILDRIAPLEEPAGSAAWRVAYAVMKNNAASPETKARAEAMREDWTRHGRYPETPEFGNPPVDPNTTEPLNPNPPPPELPNFSDALEDDSVTGLYHAQTDADRARLGLPPRFKQPRTTDQDAWDRATAAEDAHRAAGKPGTAGSDLLTNLLNDVPRVLTKDEHALLLHEKLVREQAVNAAQAKLNDLPADTPEGVRKDAQAGVKAAQDAFDLLLTYADAAGSRAGLSLQARKMLVYQDYTLAAVVNRLKATKNLNSDKPAEWTEKDQAAAVDIANKLQQAQERVEALEAENSEQVALIEQLTRDVERAQTKLENRLRTSKARVAISAKLDPKIEEAKARIEARRKANRGVVNMAMMPTPDMLADLKDYAIIYSAQFVKGAVTLNAFSEQVIREVGDWIAPHVENLFRMARAHYIETAESVTGDEAPTPDTVVGSIDPNQPLDKVDVWRLARAHVVAGLRGRNVLDAVFNDLVKLYPNLTREAVSEEFTGYGKVTYPSTKEVPKELRRIRALEREYSKQLDIAAGQMPKRTGYQGDAKKDTNWAEVRAEQQKTADALRELENQLREAGLPVPSDDKKLANALNTKKRRITNEIEEIELALKSKTPRTPKTRTPIADDAEVAELEKRLAEKRKEYADVFDQTTAREKRILASLKRRTAELERRMRERDFTAKPKLEPVNTEAKRKADFEFEKVKSKYDEMRHQYLLKNAPFSRKVGHYTLSTANLLKLLTLGFDVGVVMRQLGTSYQALSRDMGMLAPTKEGAKKRADGSYLKKILMEGVRAFGSAEYEHAAYEALRNRPNAGWDKTAGLVLNAPFDVHRNTKEDIPPANLLDNLPWWMWPALMTGKVVLGGVSLPASSVLLALSAVQKPLMQGLDRAQRAMTNQSRALFFDEAMNALHENKATVQDAKAIAKAVMVGTGRGTAPQFVESAIPFLNQVLLATRYYISRFQALSLYPMWNKDARQAPVARKEIQKMYARSVTGRATLLALAAMAFGKSLSGDDEDPQEGLIVNPTNPNFGRVRLADGVNLDFMSGLNNFASITARYLMKLRVDPETGKKEALGAGYTQNLNDEVMRFVSGKRNVLFSFLTNYHAGAFFGGKPATVRNALEEATTAIIINDTMNVYKAMIDEYGPVKGSARASLFMSLMLMGAGTSVQDSEAEKEALRIARKEATWARKLREARLNE